MKVSIDNIINTAKDLKSQKKTDNFLNGKGKRDIKNDSVEIHNKVNSRLLTIQKELGQIQSSLTKNQIIMEGINKLTENSSKGFADKEIIFNEIKFENETVLKTVFGKSTIDEDVLKKEYNAVNTLIDDDISKLKRLEVELENILASDILGSYVDDIISDLQSSLKKIDKNSLERLTELTPKAVMSLIK